ncbi:MAG: hypothetical protein JXA60_09355 [Candidatus Coatesbacteria bacterium]|nr:hypothetical protein [Candidatus Coatesbacteria bacterium]
MKRVLVAILSVLVAASLISCIGGTDPATKKALEDLSTKVATIETSSQTMAQKAGKVDSLQMIVDDLVKDVENLIKDVEELKKNAKLPATRTYIIREKGSTTPRTHITPVPSPSRGGKKITPVYSPKK